MDPPIATERLSFRSWRDDDIALARSLWGDTRVTAFIARAALDEDAIRKRLDDELRCEREHGIQYWPMFFRGAGALAGCCGLRPRDQTERIYELGFHVCAEHWGKGIATEAARAVIAYAFDVLGASALFAGHHPENVASRRTLERLGFRHTHDELYAPTGLEHPSYLLGAPRANAASGPARGGSSRRHDR